MFVKTTRVRRGNRTYEYLSLVEAVRVDGKKRHHTLFRLGEATALRESGELDRIIAALTAHIRSATQPCSWHLCDLRLGNDILVVQRAVALQSLPERGRRVARLLVSGRVRPSGSRPRCWSHLRGAAG